MQSSGLNKRHYYYYKSSWEEEFFVTPLGESCRCLVCAYVFQRSRRSSVQRHFLTYHGEFNKNFPKGSKARNLEIENLKSQDMIVKDESPSIEETKVVKSEPTSLTRLSFKIAYILSKAMRPFDNCIIAKEIMIEMSNELIEDGETRSDLLAKVNCTPLSSKTMTRRVRAISANIRKQLMKDIENCEWFSLQLAEMNCATPGDHSPQIIVSAFIRMVFEDYSTVEELLLVIPFKKSQSEKEIFFTLRNNLYRQNLGPLHRLVSITTDGSPMARFIGRCKRDPNFSSAIFNCDCSSLVHRQTLCIKFSDMRHVIEPVFEMIDYIRECSQVNIENGSPIQSLLLESRGEDGDEDCKSSRVRWLENEGGTILEKFYEALPEIKELFSSITLEDDQYFTPTQQLGDRTWLMDLVFFVDLLTVVNELNSRMQRRDITIWTSISYIMDFRSQLKLWINFFHENEISSTFARLDKTLSEESQNNGEDFSGVRFARHLEKLFDNFEYRFCSFEPIQKIREYFCNPLIPFEDTHGIATIINKLFPTLSILKIREEMVSLSHNERHRLMFSKSATPDEFWKIVDQTKFGSLVSLYKRMLSCFGSSYLCATVFTAINRMKARLRSRLSEGNIEGVLRICASSYKPDFDKLADDTRCQASH